MMPVKTELASGLSGTWAPEDDILHLWYKIQSLYSHYFYNIALPGLEMRRMLEQKKQ